MWTSGNGTQTGNTFTQSGTAFYGDYGVTVGVNIAFEVKIVRTCYRGVCRNNVYHIVTGGTGSASF